MKNPINRRNFIQSALFAAASLATPHKSISHVPQQDISQILASLLAEAQIAMLQKQREDYSAITQERRGLIDDSIKKYCST